MKRTQISLSIQLPFIFLASLQFGCADTVAVTQRNIQTSAVQLEAAKKPVEISPNVKHLISGRVLETMDSGGYTYILLENNGKKGWVAVPPAKVALGQEIQVKPGMEMGHFSSKTLDRSFDNIIFSPGIVTATREISIQDRHAAAESTNVTAEHQATASKSRPKGVASMFGSSAESPENLSGRVVETINAGGYTYISLEKNNSRTWVAIPYMKVSVDDEIQLQPGMTMTNFTSKALKRTFETIIFSDGPR